MTGVDGTDGYVWPRCVCSGVGCGLRHCLGDDRWGRSRRPDVLSRSAEVAEGGFGGRNKVPRDELLGEARESLKVASAGSVREGCVDGGEEGLVMPCGEV